MTKRRQLKEKTTPNQAKLTAGQLAVSTTTRGQSALLFLHPLAGEQPKTQLAHISGSQWYVHLFLTKQNSITKRRLDFRRGPETLGQMSTGAFLEFL